MFAINRNLSSDFFVCIAALYSDDSDTHDIVSGLLATPMPNVLVLFTEPAGVHVCKNMYGIHVKVLG